MEESTQSPDFESLTKSQLQAMVVSEREKRKAAEQASKQALKRAKTIKDSMNIETQFILMLIDAGIRLPEFYSDPREGVDKHRAVVYTKNIAGYHEAHKDDEFIRVKAVPDIVYTSFKRVWVAIPIDERYHALRFSNQNQATARTRAVANDALSMDIIDQYFHNKFPEKARVIIRIGFSESVRKMKRQMERAVELVRQIVTIDTDPAMYAKYVVDKNKCNVHYEIGATTKTIAQANSMGFDFLIQNHTRDRHSKNLLPSESQISPDTLRRREEVVRQRWILEAMPQEEEESEVAEVLQEPSAIPTTEIQDDTQQYMLDSPEVLEDFNASFIPEPEPEPEESPPQDVPRPLSEDDILELENAWGEPLTEIDKFMESLTLEERLRFQDDNFHNSRLVSLWERWI